MNPQYAWYFKALEAGGGRQLSRDQQQTLGITSEPQPGFYRKRNKNGADLPIAIWRDERGMVAVAGSDPVDAADVWTWCCQWPVSEQVWRDVAENGQPWPDDAPVAEAGIGHNQPSDPFDALTVEFEGEKELAEKFLSRTIETQEQADKAAVWAKRVAAIAKKATDLHKVEKQPHLDAGRAVDDKWRTLKEEPDALSKRLKRHLDVFLTTQRRIERERQAAELAAKQAELHGKIAEAQSEGSGVSRQEVDKLIKEVEQVAKSPINASAGRTGARVALRTFVSARIVDYDAAYAALKSHPEMKALVEQLANRAIRAGVDLAGVERVEEQRAA